MTIAQREEEAGKFTQGNFLNPNFTYTLRVMGAADFEGNNKKKPGEKIPWGKIDFMVEKSNDPELPVGEPAVWLQRLTSASGIDVYKTTVAKIYGATSLTSGECDQVLTDGLIMGAVVEVKTGKSIKTNAKGQDYVAFSYDWKLVEKAVNRGKAPF